MSDKSLLNENTVRRFMKLANVDSFTNTFVNEMGYAAKSKAADEDEKNQPELKKEQEDPEELEDPEMGEDPEDAELEFGDDLEADDDLGQADISLTEEEAQLLIDLGERLKEAMGSDMAMDEPDSDLEEPMDDMEPEEPMADEEDELMENKDEIVQEVLKRVAKRIVAQRLGR